MQTPLEIYEKAIELLNAFDTSFLELARLLRTAQDADPDLFEQLIQLPGLGRRKAYYLAKIDRVFEAFLLHKNVLVEIGWTKLSIIAPHVSAETVFHLLDLARTHTAKELTSIMKGDVPVKNAKVVVLYFAPKEYKIYAKAALNYGAKAAGRGLANQEEAILGMIAKLNA